MNTIKNLRKSACFASSASGNGFSAYPRGMKRLFFFSLLLLCSGMGISSCSADGDRQEPAEGTIVSFTLPGIDSEVTKNATTRANLESGTSVTVLVYRTGAQSSSNFVGGQKYTVQRDGSLMASNGDIRLIGGTYDFYAFTPDVEFSMAGSQPAVTVPQQKDFAVSLTTFIPVPRWTSAEGPSVKRTVALDMLVRKCAKVNFAIDVAEDVSPTITDTKITEVRLTNMPFSIITTGVDLPAGSGTTDVVLPSTLFTTGAENPRKASGGTVLLPKTAGAFNLSMKAQFNSVTTVTTQFPANSLNMAFEGGKEYTFTVRLTKDKLGNTAAGLWVTVSKWNTTGSQDVNIGGAPSGPVYTQLLGEWTNVTWDDVNLGGVPTGPVITGVSGWWNNIYYNPHLGSSDPGSND